MSKPKSGSNTQVSYAKLVFVCPPNKDVKANEIFVCTTDTDEKRDHCENLQDAFSELSVSLPYGFRNKTHFLAGEKSATNYISII